MQPYFLPYLGYFQLMAATERFVLLDDVNYIKGGWINRNRILLDGEARWLTMPLAKASPNRLICDIEIESGAAWKLKMLRSVEAAYGKARFFTQAFAILEEILTTSEIGLSRFLYRSLSILSDNLGMDSEIVQTSAVYPNRELPGARRVLDICLKETANIYVNAPGGKGLYDPDLFRRAGVELQFLSPILPPYAQNTKEFVSGLSIIDALMWNTPEEVLTMIQQYELSK